MEPTFLDVEIQVTQEKWQPLRIKMKVRQNIILADLLTKVKNEKLLHLGDDPLTSYIIKNGFGNLIQNQTQPIIQIPTTDNTRILHIQKPNNQTWAAVANSVPSNQELEENICLAVLTADHTKIQALHQETLISNQKANCLHEISTIVAKKVAIVKDKLENIQIKNVELLKDVEQYQREKKELPARIQAETEARIENMIQSKRLWRKSQEISSYLLTTEKFRSQSSQLLTQMRQLIEQFEDSTASSIYSLYFHPSPVPPQFVQILPLLRPCPSTILVLHLQSPTCPTQQKLFSIYLSSSLIPDRNLCCGFLFNLLTNKSYHPPRNRLVCKYCTINNQLHIAENGKIVVRDGKFVVKGNLYLCNQSQVNQGFREGESWQIVGVEVLACHFV